MMKERLEQMLEEATEESLQQTEPMTALKEFVDELSEAHTQAERQLSDWIFNS